MSTNMLTKKHSVLLFGRLFLIGFILLCISCQANSEDEQTPIVIVEEEEEVTQQETSYEAPVDIDDEDDDDLPF